MPDRPSPKPHTHPADCTTGNRARTRGAPGACAYAELHCLSNFSFLRGASHPEELVGQAAALGYRAVAITDRNSLAGVVRAHVAAKEHGIHLIIGSEITPLDGPPIVLLAPTRHAYGRLCRLISRGRMRAKKGDCELRVADLLELGEGAGWIGIVAPVGETRKREQGTEADALSEARRVEPGPGFGASVRKPLFPFPCSLFPSDRLFLAATLTAETPDAERLAWLEALSRETGLPLVATNAVHYHAPERRYLQDVLTCIREKCALHTAGSRLFPNAERHMRPLDEIARRYAGHEALLDRTLEIAAACTFSLDELRYEYPHELVPPGVTAMEHLARLTWEGAAERYPRGVPARVRELAERELALIAELCYEHYFLTVYDLVDFARSRGILCQGRGSAANSAVCYCLGVTAVDPARIDLLFERFISKERNEPPDIDIDFEHERREEVFQYIYEKYGRERAAIVAEVISYRPRSAVRDVGKALGLSLDRVDAIARSIDWWTREAVPEATLRAAGLDPNDRTVRMLVKLVRQLLGFPRHLSQHVGGFVLTESPLCELVPLENGAMPGRTFIEWDKDDIDAVGLLKVDCLALGMLTAISRCFGMLRKRERQRHEGTEASACGGHNGNDNARGEAFNSGDEHGSHQGAPGLDRMAAGATAREDHLPVYEMPPGVRAARVDESDATGGGVDSVEDRGGPCAPELTGRPPLPADCARLDGQTRHLSGALRGSGIRDAGAAHPRRIRRNGSGAARPDSRPGSETGLASSPSCPRAFGPSALIDIPPEDPRVYDAICRADTVGVFQIESRAQMSMLPRLRPRCFYDLVIEVAIVRPGPIQGGMVHPYLRRRDGIEPVTYPSEAIRGVLGKTLGVPLFQEQVMKIAVVAAGFTPGEADQLRRSMAAWRRGGQIDRFHTRLLDGMRRNGYTPEFAEQIFNQIRGFGEYGFPESHAASFALLVYASAWLKVHYPAAFCGALINSQPMGFYAPAQLIADARRHGVEVRPVDIMHSEWDCTLEEQATEPEAQASAGPRSATSPAEGTVRKAATRTSIGRPKGSPALRLGFRLIRGLSEAKVRGIIAARDELRRIINQPGHDAAKRMAALRAASPVGRVVEAGPALVCASGSESASGPKGALRPESASGLVPRSLFPILFTALRSLARHPGIARDTLLRLAAADAFRSLGLDRRQALWQILALDDDAPPLFADLEPDEPLAPLPEMPIAETVVHDYDTIGLSLNAHPIGLVRPELARLRVTPNEKLKIARHRQRISVAGLVINRQRPSTAKGIVFMTLEDETGCANLILRPQIWERYTAVARAKIALIADGWTERQGQVVHVQVMRVRDLSKAIAPVRATSRDFH